MATLDRNTPSPGIEETPEGYLRAWARIADPAKAMAYPSRGEVHVVSADTLCDAAWLGELVGKPVTIGHPYGGQKRVTLDDAQEHRQGVILNAVAHQGEPYAFLQVDTPDGVAYVKERADAEQMIGVSPLYNAVTEPTDEPGVLEQVARYGSNHLALTDSPRGGERARVLQNVGDAEETTDDPSTEEPLLPLKNLSLIPTVIPAPIAAFIKAIGEIVPLQDAPKPEVSLVRGITPEQEPKAQAEAAEIATQRKARKSPIPDFCVGSVVVGDLSDGRRELYLSGYTGIWGGDLADRIQGHDANRHTDARLCLGYTAAIGELAPGNDAAALLERLAALRIPDEARSLPCSAIGVTGAEPVMLADEIVPPANPTQKEGRVPLPESVSNALKGITDEIVRGAVDAALAAMFDEVKAMLPKPAEPPAPMDDAKKMLADSAAEKSALQARIKALEAQALSERIVRGAPAVAKIAKVHGVALADSAEANVSAAAEQVCAKAGLAKKGADAVDVCVGMASILADSAGGPELFTAPANPKAQGGSY